MNSLFGVELPTPITFLIAFIIVLVLIGATAWIVRRFGTARLAAGRGRQPRLAVIDVAAVDSRRKLVIIRRDNIEHLLMIGGPTDIVIESNIVRAAPAGQREAPTLRASLDTLPRVVPLPEAASRPQPAEPAARAERPRATEEAVRTAALAEELRERQQQDADPLASLTAELARTLPASAEPPVAQLRAPPIAAAPQPPPEKPIAAPSAPTPRPPPGTMPAPSAPAPAAAEANLAAMAQRLESALRRPLAPGAQPPREAPPRPSSEPKRAEKPAPGAVTPAKPTNLEQAMASLLNRPPEKT